jgi:hydrophobic/amphiphilic exporter-1 (mainly G- bacteria), HAE1 family
MFPKVDQGSFTVSIRTAPGTSLVATDRVVRQVEDVLKQVPEIQTRKYVVSDRKLLLPWTWFKHHTETHSGFYMSLVGGASAGVMGAASIGSQYAAITAKIVDKNLRGRSVQDVVDWIAARTAHIPGAEQISVAASQGMGGGGGGINMEVQGQNMDDIIRQANQLADVIRTVPGAVDVDVSYKPSKPEQRITVDRLRAAQLDMTVSQVAIAARTAIDGDDTAKFRDEGTEYPIRVHYAKSERSQTSDVQNLIIGTKEGAPVYLRDVAQVKNDFAPTKIDRKNRQRVVYVTANLAKGAQLGNVGSAIGKAMATKGKVAGTTIATGGMGKIMMESFMYMFSALILAIVLVYMLMGALFESFLTPLVIMFALPQAMIGALLALLLTGNIISIISLIGIIMLTGLVTKNAILLVDYTNTLRERGRSRHDALLEAGPTRLRPILMTTLAMIGGMMPTALALNQGSESRAPMAISVIGGLILSTMLTLIVIPVMYTIVDDLWHGLLRTIAPNAYRRTREKELVINVDSLPTGNEQEV